MGRGLHKHTLAIIRRACEILEQDYQPLGIVPTVRQLFYNLAVEELVPKSDKGYRKVQEVLADARERDLYPWEGIFDGLRQLRSPPVWTDPEDYFATVRELYCRDHWQDQSWLVELWVEKDTIRGTVQPIVDEYQIPLLVGRGYLSKTAKDDARRRWRGKAPVVIYIGDHDPSGLNMQDNLMSWLVEHGAHFKFHPLAVTEKDFLNPEISRLPVNRKDKRAPAYVKRFGDEVVEVEALAPREIQARLRKEIERRLDREAWDQSVAQEAADREAILNRLE